MAVRGDLDEIYTRNKMGGMHEIADWDEFKKNDAAREIMLRGLGSRAAFIELLAAIDPRPDLNTAAFIPDEELEVPEAS